MPPVKPVIRAMVADSVPEGQPHPVGEFGWADPKKAHELIAADVAAHVTGGPHRSPADRLLHVEMTEREVEQLLDEAGFKLASGNFDGLDTVLRRLRSAKADTDARLEALKSKLVTGHFGEYLAMKGRPATFQEAAHLRDNADEWSAFIDWATSRRLRDHPPLRVMAVDGRVRELVVATRGGS